MLGFDVTQPVTAKQRSRSQNPAIVSFDFAQETMVTCYRGKFRRRVLGYGLRLRLRGNTKQIIAVGCD